MWMLDSRDFEKELLLPAKNEKELIDCCFDYGARENVAQADDTPVFTSTTQLAP